MHTADSLNFSGTNISPHEFPKGVLSKMDPTPIEALFEIRAKAGVPVFPSPVYGAHVREKGNSQHSTKGGTRLSTATDFFVSWQNAATVWAEILSNPRLGGRGIYTDMLFRTGVENDFCMFHIDTRPDNLIWCGWRIDRRNPINYVYLHSEPKKFHEVLAKRGGW